MQPKFQDYQQAYYALLEEAELNDLKPIAFNAHRALTSNHFSNMLDHPYWNLDIKEFILFDTAVGRTKLQGNLTFEDLKTRPEISHDLEGAWDALTESMGY